MLTQRHRRSIPALSAVLLAGLLTAVGGCRDPIGDRPQGQIPLVADLTDLNVVGLAVEVTADDIPNPLVFNIPIENGVGSGTISVPAGSDRTIVVTGFNPGGVATHQGGAVVDVHPGANSLVVIALVPLDGDIPISVTGDPLTITIDPPNAAIAVGGTVEFSATVTDADGNPVNATVTWGSTNPVVAGFFDIDPVVVTGLAPGSAGIVASAGGASALAVVIVVPPDPQQFTMLFDHQALDLDGGVLSGHCDPVCPEPEWDIVIAFNSTRVPHAAVLAAQGTEAEVAELLGATFESVTLADAAGATFSSDLDTTFGDDRVILVRTGQGLIFKLGHPVETMTDVTFLAQLLGATP